MTRSALGLLLILLAPLAAAGAPASVTLESARAVDVAGAVGVTLGGGAALLEDAARRGESTWTGATGEVVLLTWTRAMLTTPQADVRRAVTPPERETYRVENATLRLAAADEHVMLTMMGEEATTMRVAGEGAATGRPVRLASDQRGVYPAELTGAQSTHPWELRAGWHFLGRYAPVADEAPLVGFPSWEAPTLDARGPVALVIQGGNVSFTDAATNRTIERRLGEWRQDASPASGLPGDARVVTFRRFLFEGEISGTAIALGESWAVAGPRVAWDVDGRVRWTDATGHVEGPEGVRRFTAATVEGAGAFTVSPGGALVREADVESLPFEAEGDWTRLSVDRRAVVTPAQPNLVAPAAGVALLALLASLVAAWGPLCRVSGVLYTRFTKDEVLDHATRKKILEAARGSPGIHLRELHRKCGGPWGVFSFHVGMLQQAGHLRMRKEGRYVAVYPPGARVPRAVPHHPVARRIHDALPADGRAVPFAELRDAVDVSRQLLSHHLKNLETMGLVVVRVAEDRRHFIARAPPDEDAQPRAGA